MNWGQSLGIDPQLSVQDLSPELSEGASNRFMKAAEFKGFSKSGWL